MIQAQAYIIHAQHTFCEFNLTINVQHTHSHTPCELLCAAHVAVVCARCACVCVCSCAVHIQIHIEMCSSTISQIEFAVSHMISDGKYEL